MVKIKICGMTNPEDCLTAVDLGVDFIGFVFYKKSARYAAPEMVREITERIDGKATTVGVFVDETEDGINELIDFCHLDFAQVYNTKLHSKAHRGGKEGPTIPAGGQAQARVKRAEGVAGAPACGSWLDTGGGGDESPRNRPAGDNRICVYRVKDHVPEVTANGLILFDSYSEGFGGSGTPFDINLLKDHSALGRAFIAGGIDEGNVHRALALKPFGIDLVSSVEKHKGTKDPLKMESLVKKVRSYQL
jgi:phosphoribosylanthranilate isomerase